MSRDERIKVFLPIGTLDGGGKEATKRSDQSGKKSENEFVNVDGFQIDAGLSGDGSQPGGERVVMECVVGGDGAVRSVERAVEMGDLEQIGHVLSDENAGDASTDEAFPTLVGRERRERIGDESGGKRERETHFLPKSIPKM